MKNDKKQLMIICEMLIFISSISSNKDFLDLLENCNEDIISLYLSTSEKYAKKYDDTSLSSSINIKSLYSDEDNNSSTIRQSLVKKQTQDYIAYGKINEDLSRELNEKTNELLLLQKSFTDLEVKYKECSLQLQQLQNNALNDNSLLQDDLLNEKSSNMKLSNEILELKSTNEKIRKEHEEKVKTLNFKISILNDKAIAYEDKIESLKSLGAENEKLKAKLKGLSSMTEMEGTIAEMGKNIEAKTRLIEALGKDKEGLNEKIARMQKELEEILMKRDKERMQCEKEIDDLRRENKRLDMILKSSDTPFNRRSSLTGVGSGGGANMAQLNQMSYENEIEDLNKALDDKDREINNLKAKITECETELSSLKSEKEIYADSKDTLYFEKEKILNELQKEQLDKQKAEMAYENRIKKLQNEINDLKQKDVTGVRLHKKNASIAGSFVPSSQGESNQKEITSLKREIEKKDELIQALKNKITSNEDDTEQFLSLLQESNGENGDKENKAKKEIEKYQHSYDELKERVNKEYELISSSFYELAIQFMNLKSEVNISKNKNQNKSWLELERAKNFP